MARALSVGKEFEIELGPFSGVYDSPDPKETRPSRLIDALNMRIPDAANLSAMAARDGYKGSTAQLGDGVSRTGKRSFMHRRLDKSLVRYVFIGSKMYEWDGAFTYTDITPAAITIDPFNVVFCATYNDFLIVSDEVNRPWVWDAEARTATTIPIDTPDTLWTTKGGPIIFDGAVVFILGTYGDDIIVTELDEPILTELGEEISTEFGAGVQNTLVWSDPGTPLIGYVQDGLNNSWRVTQASSETLGAIMAEEGAIIYFRNQGIGFFTGALGVDIRTSASKDTISATVGTNAPAATVYANKKIWFLDLDGRPYWTSVAAGDPEPLHFPVRRQVEANIGTVSNRDKVVQYGRAAFHSGYNLVLFTIWDRQTIHAFDANSGAYVGPFSIFGDLGSGMHVDAMDPMVDANNRTTFVFLGTKSATYDLAHQGYAVRQKQADDSHRWLDQLDESVDTHVPLTRAVETHWLASSAARSYRATEFAGEFLADTSRHAVGLEYITPSGGKSNRVVAQSSATVGEKSATDSISVARWTLGPNAQGTSLRIRLTATHADNVQFGVSGGTLTAKVTAARGGGL